MDKGYEASRARCRPAWGRRIAGIGRGRAPEPPFGPRDDVIVIRNDVMWACPSYSGCDSEIAFPLDAGCRNLRVILQYWLARINSKHVRLRSVSAV